MNYIELKIPVTGNQIPTQHGYDLFSAICRHVPEAHDSDWLAIDTLTGFAKGNSTTELDPRAKLKVRVPQERVALMLKLAGKQLNLGQYQISLGTPQISLLRPSSSLHARIVTIKNHQEEGTFFEAVRQKLDSLSVIGEIAIGMRRIVKIANHIVVGFAVTLHGLSNESSILLQEKSIGGRRHFGCGYFNPINSLPLPGSGVNYHNQHSNFSE
jgi:CRISPR-associated endonuclease/helicase Cas3